MPVSGIWIILIFKMNMAKYMNWAIVHNTKLPVPHLEHPKESSDYPLRVSFLEHQTVQTAHVVFMTQLSYKFENWEGT